LAEKESATILLREMRRRPIGFRVHSFAFACDKTTGNNISTMIQALHAN
jgi:hypothetical protein